MTVPQAAHETRLPARATVNASSYIAAAAKEAKVQRRARSKLQHATTCGHRLETIYSYFIVTFVSCESSHTEEFIPLSLNKYNLRYIDIFFIVCSLTIIKKQK